MNKKILACIKIFGIFYIISGIVPFANIIVNLFTPITENTMNINIYSPLVSILGIFIGYGLLKRKQWARTAAIIFSYLAIFAGIFLFFFNAYIIRFGVVFMLGIIQIYFLSRQSVKEQFQY